MRHQLSAPVSAPGGNRTFAHGLGKLELTKMRSVSIYRRLDVHYVCPSDQTVDGLWIGNGEVDVVESSDPRVLGDAVLRALRRSRTGVPHPNQSEWHKQRHRSLDPIIKTAGLQSWRSFVREAQLVSVNSDGSGVTVECHRQDSSRPEIFTPVAERRVKNLQLSADVVGTAIAEQWEGQK
ncbi:MAG: hypothetical protein AAGA65_09470 [Actinomycetota bacterium]